jgi:hypothetical protein
MHVHAFYHLDCVCRRPLTILLLEDCWTNIFTNQHIYEAFVREEREKIFLVKLSPRAPLKLIRVSVIIFVIIKKMHYSFGNPFLFS